MGQSCGCGHDHAEEMQEHSGCACGHDHEHAHTPNISPEDRKKLEEEIGKAGFQVKEDSDGNIIIAKKEN